MEKMDLSKLSDYQLRKISRFCVEHFVELLKKDHDLQIIMYPDDLLNIDEASEYLRIPVGTIRHKMDEIPHEKVGKRVLFTKRSLRLWASQKW